jgi:tRNA (mo5U34)-methyltransferase
MAFIEHSFAGDPTNWWAPNHACVLAMLRSAGFSVGAHLGHEIYVCQPSGRGADQRSPLDGSAELLAATGKPWRPSVARA